jgi:hypothetical protein
MRRQGERESGTVCNGVGIKRAVVIQEHAVPVKVDPETIETGLGRDFGFELFNRVTERNNHEAAGFL